MSLPIEIPQVIEGYADARVVWFGQGATLRVSGVSTGNTFVNEIDSDAFRQLSGLSVSEGGYELKTNDESDIASMSWSKDTESPVGVCSLQLFPRKDYLRMIAPEDVLLVYGKKDKVSPESFISLISIDAINETRSVSGSGATITRVSIQGRDLGKILMQTPTVYDSAFGGLVTRNFYTQFLQAFTASAARGGPSVVVQTFLAIFYSLKQNFVTLAVGQQFDPTPLFTDQPADPKSTPLTPFRFPGDPTKSLFSFLDTNLFVQRPMVGAMLQKDEPTLLQNAANLWTLCEMYANRLVNEFFIDVRDLVPGFDEAHKRAAFYAEKFLFKFGDGGVEQDSRIATLSDATTLETRTEGELLSEAGSQVSGKPVIALIHRQLPYDTMSFYALPTSIVYETEVFSNDTGLSSSDVRNFFRLRLPGLVNGPNQDVFTDLQFGVTINRESISKHGLRRFEGESIYFWTTAIDGSESFQPTFEFYLSLVTTWYAYNERLFSGSMTMRFRPDIRVGTRLTFVKTRTYYVSGSPSISLDVTDFYVQGIQHTYSPNPNASRTVAQLVRGIHRDGLAVQAFKESHLFWTDQGGSLDPDPYEIVVSEDLFTVGTSSDVVPNITVAPGDP